MVFMIRRNIEYSYFLNPFGVVTYILSVMLLFYHVQYGGSSHDAIDSSADITVRYLIFLFYIVSWTIFFLAFSSQQKLGFFWGGITSGIFSGFFINLGFFGYFNGVFYILNHTSWSLIYLLSNTFASGMWLFGFVNGLAASFLVKIEAEAN